jgi:hypothetical protein
MVFKTAAENTYTSFIHGPGNGLAGSGWNFTIFVRDGYRGCGLFLGGLLQDVCF